MGLRCLPRTRYAYNFDCRQVIGYSKNDILQLVAYKFSSQLIKTQIGGNNLCIK